MTAAVPTLRPLPTGVTHERRALNRRRPASELTVREPGRTTYWVRAGRSEVLAEDAADQARIIALHNIINGHSTREECARRLREEA